MSESFFTLDPGEPEADAPALDADPGAVLVDDELLDAETD
jgi:hypothetical protein